LHEINEKDAITANRMKVFFNFIGKDIL